VRIHRPISLGYLPAQTGTGLVRLSGLEGLTRSLLMGTVPLIALDRLGSKAAVSWAYTAGAVLTLLVTLNLGKLEQRMARRWVMTIGILSLFSAAILFTIDLVPAFVLAIGLRSAAASIFSVLVTLYVMDFIGKGELIQIESNRMVYNGIGWLIGPSLGLWLARSVDPAAPFVLSAALSVPLLAYYWWLRVGNSEVITVAKTTSPSALANIPRFFGQKYMRIAYTITFIRALFWVALFVFSPIYVVEAGFDEWVAGAVLSGVAALLLTAPLIKRLADNWGTRKVVYRSFALVAVSMVGLAALGDPSGAGIALWFSAAIGAAAIDVVGNIPFMRMVKPRERVPMATVFSTWREMSALIAPLLAALVLGFGLPFTAFFALIGVLSLVASIVSLRLPRRL
jgi:ACDE family multidrug resistance protein